MAKFEVDESVDKTENAVTPTNMNAISIIVEKILKFPWLFIF